MKPDIKLLNCLPSEQQSEFLYRKLEVLEDLCPDETYISIVLKREGENYTSTISIRNFFGHMEEETTNTDFSITIKDCFDRIFGRIREWKKSRFDEPFHLESDFENDSYSAMQETLPSEDESDVSVLIIDDDPGSSTVLKTIFQNAGYKTNIVMDSFKAMQEVRNHHYDLIVLDWCLPYLDGGEVIRRADEQISRNSVEVDQQKTPVITCSGLSKDGIHLPDLKNFTFIDHWHKALPFSSIMSRATQMLREFKSSRAAA